MVNEFIKQRIDSIVAGRSSEKTKISVCGCAHVKGQETHLVFLIKDVVKKYFCESKAQTVNQAINSFKKTAADLGKLVPAREGEVCTKFAHCPMHEPGSPYKIFRRLLDKTA